ncbi:MAG: hypothetical protein OXC13_15115 [Caldilineaceae bacterium]|nr:hypothetical protein [Caldilineaceae bacterium]
MVPAPQKTTPTGPSRHEEALGRNRGGLDIKIIALTYKVGRFVKLCLKPGHAAECPESASLLDEVPLTETKKLLGGKTYDSDDIRRLLASCGTIATIPPRSNRRQPATYDTKSYKGRHLIEYLFMDTKQFRGIATRFAKLAIMFEG